MVGNDKQGERTTPESSQYMVTKCASNSISQTPARLTAGHLRPWLMLPWLALPFALPCLCCLVATGYMVKKLMGWIS